MSRLLSGLVRDSAPSIAMSTMIKAGDTDIDVPRSKLTLAFSRSSGAGGQNVNKVETKAEIRVHVPSAEWMDEHTKGRIYELYGNAVNKDGELIVTSQEHRTRERNIEAAVDKLRDILRAAARIPAVRQLRTDLTQHAKEQRKVDKRIRSEVKSRRRSSGSWDD